MQKELPRWSLPVAVVLGTLLIGGIAVTTLRGQNAPVGQDIKVRPGMYDMRAEMQKAHPSQSKTAPQ